LMFVMSLMFTYGYGFIDSSVKIYEYCKYTNTKRKGIKDISICINTMLKMKKKKQKSLTYINECFDIVKKTINYI